MWKLLDPTVIGAFALGFALTGAWAVLVHGPEQYRAGGIAKAAQLDAATNVAIKELSNEADRAAFLRRQCRDRDGVYDFATGQCVERPAE